MSVDITKLANGLTVATETMPHLESACLGIWVKAGARDEAPGEHGIAHLLEHMAFKGTSRRSARQIAEEIEDVGGEINAGTSVETTSYYARVLKNDVPLALDILTDILLDSRFDEAELEREQQVILQEIGAAEDTPDDIVFDHFQEAAFRDQIIGRPILGTRQTVKSFTPADLRAYLARHYSPANMIVAAAGAVDHRAIVDQVTSAFGSGTASPLPKRAEPRKPALYTGGEFRQERDLMDAQMVLGFEGRAYYARDFYASQVLSLILGGGMSSRLFQEIPRAPRPVLRHLRLPLELRRQRHLRRPRGDRRGRTRRTRAGDRGGTAEGRRRHHRGRGHARPRPDARQPSDVAGEPGRANRADRATADVQRCDHREPGTDRPARRDHRAAPVGSGRAALRQCADDARGDRADQEPAEPRGAVGAVVARHRRRRRECGASGPGGRRPLTPAPMGFLDHLTPTAIPLLEGTDVVLRAPRRRDFEAWAKLRSDSRGFLKPWEPQWSADELSLEAFRARLRRYEQDARERTSYTFFLFDRSGETLYGGTTVGQIRRGVAQNCMLGYWMGEAHAGKGLMRQAVELLKLFAFDVQGLHRMEAACLPTNRRSIGLLDACGFTREGYLRSYLKIAGRWEDHLLFGLVAEDWARSSTRATAHSGQPVAEAGAPARAAHAAVPRSFHSSAARPATSADDRNAP